MSERPAAAASVRRRRLRWYVISASAVLVFLVTWLLVTGLNVQRDLRSARAAASGLASSSASASDLVATIGRTRALIVAADARVHDPVWTVASHIPLLGRTPNAVRVTTSAANAVLQAIRPVESQLAAAVPTPGEPVSPALVEALSATLTRIGPVLTDESARLARLPLGGVPGAIAGPVREVRDLLANVADNLEQYQSLATVAPILLGMDRPHTWLLLMLNGAEARATGGFVGATGLLRAERGRLKLRRLEPNEVLARFPLTDADVDAAITGTGMIDLYGSDLKRIKDFNQTPNFAVVARLALTMEQRAHGSTPDGVIAMDEHAMAALMKVTGSVKVGRTTVSADTAVRFITRDVYQPFLRLPVAKAVAAKDAMLAELVTEVFRRFSNGSASPVSMVQAIAASAVDGRISLYSANPREQGVIAKTAVAHTPGSLGWPSAQVVVVNGGGNKLEAYIQADVRYVRGACLGSKSERKASIEVTLNNRAPRSGLPSYVAGRLDLHKPNPKPQGSNRELVFVHVPRGSYITQATYDGAPVTPSVDANESHRRVFKFVLESTGGKSQTLKIDYNEATNDQAETDRMGVQPMTLPMTATTVPAAICPKVG